MKKRKDKNNEINDGHYLELMDRLHIQSCMIEDHLVNHPLTKKIKKVKKLIDDAGWALAEAYQIVGYKSYQNDEQKNPIKQIIFGRHQKSKDRRLDDSEKLRTFREPHSKKRAS